MKFSALFVICFKICVVITAQRGCRSRSNCIALRNCQPFMTLIDSLEKPLKYSVVEFLRQQECGFANGYPLVCCSVLPKNLRVLKNSASGTKDSRKNGILVELLDTREESTIDISGNNRLPINDDRDDRIKHITTQKTTARSTSRRSTTQRPSTTRRSTTRRPTTSKSSTTRRIITRRSTTMPRKIYTFNNINFDKKSDAINYAFGSSDMFDFGMFDLFRRKRIAVDNDTELDIEIR